MRRFTVWLLVMGLIASSLNIRVEAETIKDEESVCTHSIAYDVVYAPQEEMGKEISTDTLYGAVPGSGDADEIESTATQESTTETESTAEVTTEKETTEKETTENLTTEKITTEKITTEKVTTEKATTEKETTKSSKITAWGKYKGKYYNDKKEVIPGAIKKGIDVSKYQGDIDYEKLSKSDIDFVIIRCGYGDDFLSQDDSKFLRNVEMCEKYGIPYGIYMYSYAVNMTMVKSEVKHTLRLLKAAKAKPAYPVYYDMEESAQYMLDNKVVYGFAKYFCTKMLKAGYKTGVYSSLWWWNTKLTDKGFVQWYRWVAQYNSECTYTGSYNIWQSTSGGVVSGIAGRVDLNFQLYDECEDKGHSNKWVTIKEATVFSGGERKRVCKKCGKIIKYQKTAILKPTGHLNKKNLDIKKKTTYKKLKAVNLANGDYVLKYKSSDKTRVRVSKKGYIRALKRGRCFVTVFLASGKKMKINIHVV